MSNYSGDLGTYLQSMGATNASRTNNAAGASKSKANSAASSSMVDIGLDMTDFLTLMIAQFQNQTIDDTADTSDMLNQLVQMQMVQALVNMTDASVMTYAASLVGKEVTVVSYDAQGKPQEIVGTVTATGMYKGSQVVFIGDSCYNMSQILAVGRLPEEKVPETPDQPDKNPGQEGEGKEPPKTDPT